MAKKASSKSDRNDPRQNKSLAIRNVLKKMPSAKATEVADAVQKEYGHEISQNMVYMVKTKGNMATDGRVKKASSSGDSPLTSPALWVDAIKQARQLLKSTGSLANATALLKAIDG
ncbi:hypothetical protein NA78x_005830 [Anatilimnocola sp. NA78]|uniref:hypothetical protein n=1 Tax=Anatilimnocola sp. NA78 TaxID=3415683 RepID=UPI003CE58465